MDAQLSDLLLQDCGAMLLDFDSVSDAGYHSACDGLSSPASSCSSPSISPLDSGVFSWPSAPSPLWSSVPEKGEILKGSQINDQHAVQLLQTPSPAHSSIHWEQTIDFQLQDHTLTTATSSQSSLPQFPVLPDIEQQMAAFQPQLQTPKPAFQPQLQTPKPEFQPHLQTPKPQQQQHQNKRLSCTRQTGRKRHSASEREKLRMRDLTKALHHLRTYLPPSVAPEGQTLTKIQTLRLAIRYIDHLSAQLGSRDEACRSHRRGPGLLSAPWGYGPELEGNSSRLEAGQVVVGVKREQTADSCQYQAHRLHTQCRSQGSLDDLLIHGPQHQSSCHWGQHKEPHTQSLAQYASLQQNQHQDVMLHQQQGLLSIGQDFYYPLQ